MTRRVWIIAKKEKIKDGDIVNATLNNCPEIANGIPPALQDKISQEQLPMVYEEPESPLPALVDWQAEWDKASPDNKVKVLAQMLGLTV